MTALTLVFAVGLISFGDDPKPAQKVLPAAEAKDHLDKPGVYELTVQLTKNADTRMEHYLDSEADFHDAKNLAIVIHYDDLPAFKKVGIEDPSKHYLNKKIRVSGTPKKEGEQIRIRITEPKSITIVEAKKP